MIAMEAGEGVSAVYLRFLEALKTRGFDGEIAPDYAHRTVLATDNSIYQRLPQAAVFPRHAEDLECLAKLAAEAPYREVVLTPRGGGTGTNGQSLTDGIVVDISRHMNQVLDIDV
ncbi:FAD-binding oxidoreductase, partial [Halomonas citrativorans]|uniref:FAD-binding oxidoreductase n=1 Tax=Halomonas citrativorans TaxID=2742612 RepID=UPI001866FD4E